MRVLASDRNLTQLERNNAVLDRSNDGTFHVTDSLGKSMVKSGEYAAVGTNFRGVQGYKCSACGHLSVLKSPCGKCGNPDMIKEQYGVS